MSIDYDSMSDDEIRAAYEKAKQEDSGSVDYDSMNDDEIRSAYEKARREDEYSRKVRKYNAGGMIGEGRTFIGTDENGADVFDYDAEHAPAFAPDDDEGKAIHEKVKGYKGATLSHSDRPFRVNRGKDGKVESYSTTESTVVEELDGTWSVIPTLWKGEDGSIESAIDDEDAARHYRDTEFRSPGKPGEKVGERFGNFATKEEAKAAAEDIHQLHARMYQHKWNQYINEHWDEISDEIKGFKGVKEAHEAWEKAGRPGVRFSMSEPEDRRSGEGGDGDANSKWPWSKDSEPMGVGEHARISLQAKTGNKYSTADAVLRYMAPFGMQAEGIDANAKTAALEKLRSGDFKDDEAEDIGRKALGAEYDEIMRVTTGGQEGKRREYLSMAATDALVEQTRNKQDASRELYFRPLKTRWKAVSPIIENFGYVSSFAYGSAIIPTFALEGATGWGLLGRKAINTAFTSSPVAIAGGIERAGDLMNKSYEVDGADNLKVIDNNYGELRSIIQGGGGSVVENVVVEGMTDIAIDAALLGLSRLKCVRNFIIPTLKGMKESAVRKMMQSSGGRFLLRAGNIYGQFDNVTHVNSIPVEQFEEIITPIFDDVFGLGKKKGEESDTFGKYAKNMFTLQNQIDIFCGLIGTVALQGAASAALARRPKQYAKDVKTARQQLVDAGADAKQVAALDDESALQCANAYVYMSQSPENLKKFTDKLDSASQYIMEQVMAREGANFGASLEGMGVKPRSFTIPTRKNAETGKVEPDFRRMKITNMANGEEEIADRVVGDDETGVFIIDRGEKAGNSRFTVWSLTGSADFMSIASAQQYATNRMREIQLYMAHDAKKMQYIENERREKFGNANVEQYRTVDEAIKASKAHGVDVEKDKNFNRNRKGWHVKDAAGNDFVILVRNNINSPWQVQRVLRHEVVGHSETANGVTFLDEAMRGSNDARKKVEGYLANGHVSGGIDRAIREGVANTIQQRSHHASRLQKRIAAVRGWLRKHGFENLGMSESEFETRVEQIEKEMAGYNGSFEIGKTFSPYDYVSLSEIQPEPQAPGGTGSQTSEESSTKERAENPAPTASAEDVSNKEATVEPSDPAPVQERPAEAATAETPKTEAKTKVETPKAETEGVHETGETVPETGKEAPKTAPDVLKTAKEFPYSDNGEAVGNVGDSLELENGMVGEVSVRKNGTKKWVFKRGKRWTVDYGKTWHEGLKPGDRFTEEDYDNDKVPSNVHFGNTKSESGIWEVDYISKNGDYELKPVPKTAEAVSKTETSAPESTSENGASYSDWSDKMLDERLALLKRVRASITDKNKNRTASKAGVDREISAIEAELAKRNQPAPAEEVSKGSSLPAAKSTKKSSQGKRTPKKADSADGRRNLYAEERGGKVFRHRVENGRLLNKPPTKNVRRPGKNGGFKTQFVGEDPAVEVLNHIYDGLNGDERRRMNELLFGEYPVGTSRGGNDAVLDTFNEENGTEYTIEEFVDELISENSKFEKWVEDGAFSLEEEEARDAEDRERSEAEKPTNAEAKTVKPAVGKTEPPARKTAKKPSIAMKSEAEEKRVDALENDLVADFDSEEFDSSASERRTLNVDSAEGSNRKTAKVRLPTITNSQSNDAGIVSVSEDEVKRAIQRFRNGDWDVSYGNVMNTLSDIGKLFKMSYAGRSRYGHFYIAKIGKLVIRLSDHNAYGSNFEKDGGDRNLSVYIERVSYPVGATSVPFTEIRYTKDAYDSNPDSVIKSIIDGISDVVDGKEYTVDPSLGERKDYSPATTETAHNLEDSESESGGRKAKSEPKKTKKMFKLFRRYSDGTYGALFIDSSLRLVKGEWYAAKSPSVGKLRELDGMERSKAFKWGKVYLFDGEGNATPVDKMPSVAQINQATDEGKRYMTVTFGSNGKKLFYNLGINGSGSVAGFAFRPGWHSTNAPSAGHIGKSHGMKGEVAATGQNHYRRSDEVWCEIEVPADIDYNEAAMARAPFLKERGRENEKNRKEAQLDYIPVGGSYFFRTNSNADERQDWVISGAIRIVREIPRAEVNRFNRENGFLPDAPIADTKEEAMAKQNAKPTDVDWSSDELDVDKFQSRVGKMMKLVVAYRDNGVADFNTLATRLSEKFPEKWDAMRPYLRGIWNVVAEQLDLEEVSKKTANEIYATIGAKRKDAGNGSVGQSGGTDGDGNQPLGGVLPETYAQTAEGKPTRGRSPEGGEVHAGAGVPGESGHAGYDVGGGSGAADPRSGGEGDNAGNGKGGKKAGEASGRAGKPDGREVPAGGRVSQPGEHDRGEGHESGRASVNAATKAADETKVTPPKHPDFVMTKAVEDAILEPNPVNRAKQNLAAIRILNTLNKEGRTATPAEQETLAKYVGWGGLSQFLDYSYDRAWAAEKNGYSPDALVRSAKFGMEGYEIYKEMRALMSDKELRGVRESTLSAFYTPIRMVRIEHDALRALGVTGGRFLGPSAGVGNYASAQGDYAKGVRWQFVELDETTGGILKHLFPNQRVEVSGYENTALPDSFYDVAIDNVPYIDFDIRTDKAFPSMKIHDYFFAKTLSKLRPGGMMMFLTSTGTLDKQSATLRKYLSDNGGQIVGAVRLPNKFFSKNAGTDVAADLVIVQKRDGAVDNSAFNEIVKVSTEHVRKGRNVSVVDVGYNRYFAEHPEQVIGDMKVVNDKYGKQAVQYEIPDGDLYAQVREAIDRAIAGVDRDALLKSATVAEVKDHTPIYDENGLRQGSVTEKDGKFYIKAGNELIPIALPTDEKTADGVNNKGYTKIRKELMKRGRDPKKLMRGIFGIRKAMRDVIDAEMRNCTDEELMPLLGELNRVYDEFVRKFGNLSDSVTQKFVLLDSADGNRMMALERKEKDGEKDVIRKSDIFTKRVIFTGETPTKADTPMDAMIISYSETGTLDIPRVANLLGVGEEEAVARLKKDGNVFDNPQTGKLEPSWQYLSGRVRAKLAAARAAAEREPAYWDNVKALEKVIPADVALHDVTIPFGASWVDPEVMTEFMKDAFGSDYLNVKFGLIPQTGTWTVETGRGNLDRMENPWGETTFAVEDFIYRVLNNGTMDHYNSYPDPADPRKKIREFDHEGTEKNKLAKERLNRAFESFVQNSDKWHDKMERHYNDVMNDGVPIALPAGVLPFDKAGMKHDSILKLFDADENGDPDMRKPKKGREYQSGVIATGVLGGQNLYLAHAVGAGKTMEMQSISMLGRHLGQFKKPIHVVPNHMLEQYCNEFLADFPDANILKMTEADASPENRRKFFAMVANGDWDAIVVRRDTFVKKLPMSPDYQTRYYDNMLAEMEQAIAMAQEEQGDKSPTVKELEKKFKRAKEKVERNKKKLLEKKDANIVPFEELGIDQIFVDEAHNYKGLPVVTSQGNVKGLQQGESSRAEDMEMKCDYIQSLRGGNRGVVFASGTSLSNAPVLEAYTILRFLAKDRLAEQGLSNFDQFVNQFGTIETVDKLSQGGTDTKESVEVTGLNNAPEMMRLFKSVVNIVNSEDLDLPRPSRKLMPVQVQMTDAQKTVMHMIARECMISGGQKDRGKGLSLANIAKSVCISPRLLGIDDDGGKLNEIAVRVRETWENTADNNGTQLIFTDKFNLAEDSAIASMDRYLNDDERKALKMSGAKSFNFNHAIVEALVRQGIPRSQIAVMQDLDKVPGDKDANKAELFKKVKSGEVRVLIGSRARMGEGTNVQDRLAAIHLVHPGWKPAEDEQAEGRIIRWGNIYKEGKIFYYLTQGDKDVGSYETANHELIGKKSALINKILRGDGTLRKLEMNNAEDERDLLMGLTINNPNLAELVKMRKPLQKLDLDVNDLMTQARRKKDAAAMMKRKLNELERDFDDEKKRIGAWIEKQDGRPFAVDTEDGRHIAKMNELAAYINDRVRGELVKDAWQRENLTVGMVNGSPLEVRFGGYGEESFKLGLPELGVWKDVSFTGFEPNLTMQGMAAFVNNEVRGYATPEYVEAYKGRIDDARSQIGKVEEQAGKFEADYKGKSKKLAEMKRRKLELERIVYPLVVKTTEMHGYSAYGNWVIARQKAGGFRAGRVGTDERLSADTVRELLPMIDAADMEKPDSAVRNTVDLVKMLKDNGRSGDGEVKNVAPADVDFDTEELDDEERRYAESEDKTPTEKVMRDVFGMTNAEIATALRAAGMEPHKHQRKTDDQLMQQANVLLSNPGYMAKLSHAVYKVSRPVSDYENVALNVLLRQREEDVNERKAAVDGILATPDDQAAADPDYKKNLETARKELAEARTLMHEAAFAASKAATEQGRALRSNRVRLNRYDFSYAGILGSVQRELGSAEVPAEIEDQISELANEFRKLDEDERALATARLKAFSEKLVSSIRSGTKMRRAGGSRKLMDEARRVARNYADALAQIEVGAVECGGTLIGLSDQMYPAWGRWLRQLGEYHCFNNPDITEDEVIQAILDDISPFMDGVDANQVRDALTGFGHNYKQSRYESQRLMNDLRAQARMKRQLDYMDEHGKLPPKTGMIRDDLSPEARELARQVQEKKKETPEGAANSLKSALDSAKTRIRNRIEDLKRAIESGEAIERSKRSVAEDDELRQLKAEKEDLQKRYDEVFGTVGGMTEEQRIKSVEKALARALERANADLARAMSGDFSKPSRNKVDTETANALRDEIRRIRENILDMKRAAFEYGMTPEEIEARNVRRLKAREDALNRLTERIERGDIRPYRKPQPPMTPEQQRMYDEMGAKQRKARAKLAQMRLDAQHATRPKWVRKATGAVKFAGAAIRATMATVDFSAVLRQSATISLGHPKMAVKAFGAAWASMASEDRLAEINGEILSDSDVKEAMEKYGLNMRSVDSDDARDAEIFHGVERNTVKIRGKEYAMTDIPLFGKLLLKSERHYITYLNSVSADLYKSIVNDRVRFPEGPSPWQKKMICDLVNIWNGSGAMSKERRAALMKSGVNEVFWAPGLVVSRIQSALGYDILFHNFFAEGLDAKPVSMEERIAVAKIAVGHRARFLAASVALGLLFAALQWDSGDWGEWWNEADIVEKFMMLTSPVVKNTTIDLTGGERTVTKFVHDYVKGERRTARGKIQELGKGFGVPTRTDLAIRFVRGKFSPALSMLLALADGKDYVGNEFGLKEAAMSLVPLSVSDIYDQLTLNGIWTTFVTAPLTLLGAGGTTYER